MQFLPEVPKGVRKRFLGTGTPHFSKLFRNFDFAECKSQKSAYFLWFFEKCTQTTVISRKIALSSIFFLNLIILILSCRLKQNLQEKTQKQKNGIWLKWRRNRPKSTKIVPVHSQGRPRRGQVQFWSIFADSASTSTKCHFFVSESFSFNFCFIWKLSM